MLYPLLASVLVTIALISSLFANETTTSQTPILVPESTNKEVQVVVNWV